MEFLICPCHKSVDCVGGELSVHLLVFCCLNEVCESLAASLDVHTFCVIHGTVSFVELSLSDIYIVCKS